MSTLYYLLSGIAAIVMLYLGIDWKNLLPHKKRLSIACVLIIIVCTYLGCNKDIEDKKESAIAARHGTFEEPDVPDRKFPVLKFGRTSFSSVKYPFLIQGEKPFYAWLENGKIMVNAFIRDSRGNPVAKVKGRDWEPIATEGIDYNNDDTGFEVVTSDDKVVFQVDFLKDTIYFTGLICSEKRMCGFVATDGTIAMVIRPDSDIRFNIPKNAIIPLFKYPRWKFLGKRFNEK